jgi:hypothetical protein
MNLLYDGVVGTFGSVAARRAFALRFQHRCGGKADICRPCKLRHMTPNNLLIDVSAARSRCDALFRNLSLGESGSLARSVLC